MRKKDGRLIFSPSDLNVFFESPFASWMERHRLESPSAAQRDVRTRQQALLGKKGDEHEARYLAELRASGLDVWEPPPEGDAFAATLDAMRSGRAVLYQAALRDGAFEGHADFLFRTEIPSPQLGAFSYEVADTKLANQPKPYFLLQLSAYAEMLERVQGVRPGKVSIVTGARARLEFRTDDFFFYYLTLKRAFLDAQERFTADARPVPDARADHGAWQSVADRILEELDHPSRVAFITGHQVKRLAEVGITTMRALGDTRLARVPKMDDGVFARLKDQARLTVASAGRARPLYEVILDGAPVSSPQLGLLFGAREDARRGLALLPPASPLDVFFDMEGYPFAEGGLEYLFGATTRAGDTLAFTDFWAHGAKDEQRAFEAFVDWTFARYQADPSMHVYHYAPYEVTALRRLMGRYGTRESEVDTLLRGDVFVDLYKIVRQAIRVGEPGYSLKNVEHLYRARRAGAVSDAGESVVEYARWLEEQDGATWESSDILRGIRDYNRDDCESTAQLTAWLRERQSETKVAWVPPPPRKGDATPATTPEKWVEAEALAARLRDAIPPDRSTDPERWRIQELLSFLVTFHRREEKPIWWALFDRQTMSDEELAEDIDCLAGLVRTNAPPHPHKQSLLYEYRFDPRQDTKLGAESSCRIVHDMSQVTIETFDGDAGLLTIKVHKKKTAPRDHISLVTNDYVSADPIAESIRRTAKAWEETGRLPPAIDTLLRKARPRIAGKAPGAPILSSGEERLAGITRAIHNLTGSAIAMQGPPGAGKTTTASHVIISLIQAGYRVGVSSNGHKAIEKLMAEALLVADKFGIEIRATKIKSESDEEIVTSGHASHAAKMADVGLEGARGAQLVGGTAWAFSHPSAAGKFDYLFVDEAGQVSLANLVGMAPAAKNLVLIGDQMQLGQPIKGSHPGESGTSALEYLLAGRATIPADMGIFLATTWRLHPDLCRFISGAVYEGLLEPAPETAKRVVKVAPAVGGGGTTAEAADRGAHARREAGIVFVPVEHEGNAQESEEETRAIVEIVAELCGRELTGKDGRVLRALGRGDVLVVAPYNMQVRRLREALPGVRVGSVDKFQGQEAPVVIVSMCASSGESSPRGIEFLFSANRLNVALSRAESLAIIVGSPKLARTVVGSVHQMKLVNLFCRAAEEGRVE